MISVVTQLYLLLFQYNYVPLFQFLRVRLSIKVASYYMVVVVLDDSSSVRTYRRYTTFIYLHLLSFTFIFLLLCPYLDLPSFIFIYIHLPSCTFTAFSCEGTPVSSVRRCRFELSWLKTCPLEVGLKAVLVSLPGATLLAATTD